MKEIPILYSTNMVQAKLAGRKTQTRRTRGLELINQEPDNWQLESLTFTEDRRTLATFFDPVMGEYQEIKCPYGFPGDVMWVRETWALGLGFDYDYKASNQINGIKWKPSIHMPKSAARIWDKVVRIRVERLQEISEDDAKAEGVDHNGNGYKVYQPDVGLDEYELESAYWSFNSLWCSIHGGDSWDQNPWIWVIETETLSISGRTAQLERKEVAV